MNTRSFKRLFEVRILHGFFLDFRSPVAPAVPLPFWELNAADQADVLLREILEGRFDIRRDVEIRPFPETERLLRGLKMPVRTGPASFFVGAEVEAQPANTFKIREPLPDDTRWTFAIKLKNPAWLNFTNHALRTGLPGRYFFTNDAPTGSLVLPSLATLPLPFSAARTWEMGSLVMNGATLLQARRTTSALADFDAVATDFRHPSEADRVALPKKIRYRFNPSWILTTLTATLSPIGGGPAVKTITADFTGKTPTDWGLDFFAKTPASPELTPEKIPDGPFQLTITNGATTLEQREIRLFDLLDRESEVFAVVEMRLKPTEPTYSLLNADGTLRGHLELLPARRWVTDAVFDLRFAARRTYWQYVFEQNAAPGGAFQAVSPTVLRSSTARSLSLARQPVAKPAGLEELPNPERTAPLLYQPDLASAANPVFVSQMFLRSL